MWGLSGSQCGRIELMKRFVILWLALASVALAFDPLPPIPSTTGLESAEQIILDGTNRERAVIGLAPLKPDLRLQAAARLQAADLAERNYFSHTSDKFGFETPSKRINQAGALDFGAGENIAFNEVNPDQSGAKLMNQWMNSPPHRAAILNADYTHIGVGVYRRADGRIYGVQNFVQRQLEVIADTTRAVLELRLLRLEGQASAGLELAMFSGQQYLGMLPTDISGRFSRVLDFTAGQMIQIGWRKIGVSGAFLTQASLTMPSVFTAGTIPVQTQNNAPYRLNAALEARIEDTFTLELRFLNATKAVILLEGQERQLAQNGVVRTRCAVGAGRKALQLGYGNGTFIITHRFALDCANGKLIAGATR